MTVIVHIFQNKKIKFYWTLLISKWKCLNLLQQLSNTQYNIIIFAESTSPGLIYFVTGSPYLLIHSLFSPIFHSLPLQPPIYSPSISLVFLVCCCLLKNSTYMWDHMGFAFLIFLSMMHSRFIHVVIDGKISSFFQDCFGFLGSFCCSIWALLMAHQQVKNLLVIKETQEHSI